MKILLDFDGTCVKKKNPGVGEDVPGAKRIIRELVKAGHEIILFTVRGNRDEGLQDATDWFAINNIPLIRY